jgi:tetratricopeptide (TPR) repeat protein
MQKLIFSLLLLVTLFSISCNSGTEQVKDESTEAKQIKALSKKIERSPTEASLYFERGGLYQKVKEDSLAYMDLLKAAELDTTKANYFSALGNFLFSKKDVAGSVIWFQKALKLNPEDETAQLKIAHMFFFMQDYPKAFVSINNVLRQNVYNAEAYFLKGMCYKDMKDTAHAISNFQTAVQTEPKYFDALMQLGILYEAKKDPLALQYYENAFLVDTNNMQAIYAMGMLYQNQNKFEEAKKVFKRAILINKDFATAHYNTGWMLLQQDSTEKAYRAFDRAIQAQPDYADAYYNRGLCSEILNKYAEAKSDYDQATIFNPAHKLAKTAMERVSKKM